MFTKLEMVGAIAISLFGGFAIGYSKAREICLQAIDSTKGGGRYCSGFCLFTEVVCTSMWSLT